MTLALECVSENLHVESRVAQILHLTPLSQQELVHPTPIHEHFKGEYELSGRSKECIGIEPKAKWNINYSEHIFVSLQFGISHLLMYAQKYLRWLSDNISQIDVSLCFTWHLW